MVAEGFRVLDCTWFQWFSVVVQCIWFQVFKSFQVVHGFGGFRGLSMVVESFRVVGGCRWSQRVSLYNHRNPSKTPKTPKPPKPCTSCTWLWWFRGFRGFRRFSV